MSQRSEKDVDEVVISNRKSFGVAVVGFGLMLTVLLVGGVLGYVNAHRLQDNIGWVTHAHEVMRSLETLLSTLKDAETGQRGYLLAENENYRQPYDNALQRVQTEFSRVKELTSDNPEHQARLDSLEKKIDLRLDELKQTVGLMKNGDRTSALEIVRSDTGRAMMEGLRTEIATMQEAEQILLKKRNDESKASFHATILSILMTSIIGVVMIGTVFNLIQRNFDQRQRAAVAIVEQKERLRTTLASIGDAVISTDCNGCVTYLNAVAESLTGWTNNDTTGVPLTQVFHIVNESTRKAVENPAVRALKEGAIVGLANHTVLISRDGSERAIDDSAAPIRDATGNIVGVILVFHDVSERRRGEVELRASEERYRVLFESMAEGFCIVEMIYDSRGKPFDYRFVQINPMFEKHTGLKNALGRTIREMVPDHDSHWFEIYGAVAATGEPKRFVNEAKAMGRWYEVYAYRVGNPESRTVGLLFTDITARRLAEEQIRRSAELFTFVVERSPTGFYIVDSDFRISHMNADSQARAFRNVNPAIGRRIDDAMRVLWPEPLATEISEIFRHTLETGEPYRSPGLISSRADLKTVETYEWQLDRITMPDGTYGVLCYFYDTSELRAAERAVRASEERLRTALAAARMVAWEWTPADGKLRVSENAADVFGLPPGVGLNGIDQGLALIHPDDIIDYRDTFRKAIDDQSDYLTDYRVLRPDNGRVVWIEERGNAVRDLPGGSDRLFGIAMDITERKRGEEERERLVGQLREHDRRKDEFLAILAHELRNPLAPIRNGLQVIRLAGANDMVEQARTMMDRQLTQLVRLVDDLLDVSRITRGKLDLRTEKFELKNVIDSAVETARPLIDQGSHELIVSLPHAPVFVDADATRLAQVVSNLLTNSAKYTPHGGHVRLAVEPAGGWVSVSVTDDGIGIPSAMLDRVFEMFTQVDRRLEKTAGGLGIGLSLAKGLVEMHGGTIEARSDGEGHGSQFVVRLPIAMTDERVPAQTENEAQEVRTSDRRRVLVVDDNRDSADSLAQLLKLLGNDSRTAHDGEAGIAAAEAFRPDVVLMDIGMPKLNGYDAARRIREQPWGRNMMLVALTGWGQEDDKRLSREAGFNYHLVKPVELEAIEKMLETLKNNLT